MDKVFLNKDVYNMVKAMNNAGNQLRYDEYQRILKENASEITIKPQPNIELVTAEEVAREIACQTPDSILSYLNALIYLEKCGYHICKVKGVKDEQ